MLNAMDEKTLVVFRSRLKMKILELRGCSSVVESMLCMYEAPGSIPGLHLIALEKSGECYFNQMRSRNA